MRFAVSVMLAPAPTDHRAVENEDVTGPAAADGDPANRGADETGADNRFWRWLAYAGASALGGSPVPAMLRYEDVVDSVTVIGSEG